jgi:SAM-dependent methyltransferase
VSPTFDAYATYYDLLYKDKAYDAEAAYVDRLSRAQMPGAVDLLELGCGTGGHATELARRGYRVTGIDLSRSMVDIARARHIVGSENAPTYDVGDLRDYRAGRQFDVVVALFHVMSYQTTNADLRAGMHTAAAHLRPGGAFVFDSWYGPGVLTDPPATRVRRLSGDGFRATRVAEPVARVNENVVDVHYEILVEREAQLARIQEVHSMRYMFVPEVDLLLEDAGLRRVGLTAWMSDEAPDAGTWNACFVATL